MTTLKEDNETLETDQDRLPILGITIAAVLIFLPILVCVSMKVIASKCPDSYLGRKFNACKAENALTEEQSEMREAQQKIR